MNVDREFVRETDDTIRKLTVDLVELEESADEETLDEAFRRSHGLKGNLGMVGLEGAQDLAHALEDVLDGIRAGDRPADGAAIDAALEAADEIGRAVQRAHRDEPTPELAALTERLRSLAEPTDPGASARSSAADADDRPGEDGDVVTGPDDSDARMEDTGFVFEQAEGTADESDARGGEPAGDTGEPELDDEAQAALDAASEFDDLDDLVAAMDDDETFADLDGSGTFDDVLADDPETDPDENGADIREGSSDEASTDRPDDTPDESADAPADRGDADEVGTDSSTGARGDAFDAFQEIRAEVEPDEDLEQLQRDIEETSFGEFDDDDDVTIDELLLTEIDEPPSDEEPAGSDAGDAFEGTTDAAADGDETGTEPEPAAGDPEPAAGDPEPAIEPVEVDEPQGPAPGPASGSERDPHVKPAVREIPEPTSPEGQHSDPAAAGDEGRDPAKPDAADGSTGEPEPSAEAGGAPPAEGSSRASSGDASTSGSTDGPAESATGDGHVPERAGEDRDGLDPEVEALLSDVEVSDEDHSDDASLEAGASGTDRQAGFGGFARDESADAFEARFGGLFADEAGSEGSDARTVGTVPDGILDPAVDEGGDGGSGLPARQRTTGPASLAVDPEVGDELLRQVRELAAAGRRLAAAADRTDPAVRDALSALRSATDDVRRTALDVRLMPLSTVTDGFGRVVRDVARAAGVEVEFEAHGTDVRLDRDVLDRIGDPLVHLVRNAVDHGIEAPAERETAGKTRAGTVELRARREGDQATIEISDDGSGLDPAAVRERAVEEGHVTTDEAATLTRQEAFDLLFEPGFSTADEVTATSGRGVGMDAVARAVSDLNGAVEVESEPGAGTTVRLSVPVTVAVAEVLFLAVDDEQYAVPTADVETVQYAAETAFEDGADRVRIGAESAPFVRLSEALDAARDGSERVVVRVDPDVRDVALGADDVGEKREVVITPYEDVLGDTPGLGGATLLEDDTVVNVIDVETL